MIEITDKPIDVQRVIDAAKSPDCGAVSVFIGTVRNNSRGRKVNALEYQVYEEMAVKMIGKIIDEIKSKWDVHKAAVSHRSGRMEIGEVSVVVAVSTPHRKDAFPACQYAIDRLKEIVPIWKKEFAVDGASWVEPGG